MSYGTYDTSDIGVGKKIEYESQEYAFFPDSFDVKNQSCQELLFPNACLSDRSINIYYSIKSINQLSSDEEEIIKLTGNAVVKRMYLITSVSPVLQFEFSYIASHDFETLHAFKLLDSKGNLREEVANHSLVKDSTKLRILFNDVNKPFCDEIKMQCVYSQCPDVDNSLFTKGICFLEITSKNATAKLDGNDYPGQTWTIGKELNSDDMTRSYKVMKTESLRGPLLFSGVGIDNFCGFIFQLSTLQSSLEVSSNNFNDEQLQFFIDENFYDDSARLVLAGIKNYELFESQKNPNQSGYSEVILRSNFQELAVEDEDPLQLFKLLDDYRKWTTNPISRILPSMVTMVDRCLSNGSLGLVQSVIRMNHVTLFYPLITNKIIWSTFSSTMSTVKQFIIQRPSLNLIQCEILRGTYFGRLCAVVLVLSQILLTVILIIHITIYQCESESTCFWKSDFAIPMSIVALVFSLLKVRNHYNDKIKFDKVFKNIIKHKTNHKSGDLINTLIVADFISNKFLFFITPIVAFVLIANTGSLLDMVLNLLAVTYIVELDEQLNSRDPIEINDLIREYFKDNLKNNMNEVSQHLDNQLISNDCIGDLKLFEKELLQAKYDVQ